jgi:hypothetical protein
MRAKLIVAFPEIALTRILDALERELVEATDEEIMQAAMDLGMNPNMKGSAAFAGLKYPPRARLSDFFASAVLDSARLEAPQSKRVGSLDAKGAPDK